MAEVEDDVDADADVDEDDKARAAMGTTLIDSSVISAVKTVQAMPIRTALYSDTFLAKMR